MNKSSNHTSNRFHTVCAAVLLCAATATAQTFTTLVNFNGADGGKPLNMSLIQGLDGNLYGTTSQGGANNNNGTVFKMTTSGALTTLHSFNSTDGKGPVGSLLLGTDGNYYGTTADGGIFNLICKLGCGTIFQITPAGSLTTLHSFDVSDGSNPEGALIQATDGNFYGTTAPISSTKGAGTVFQLTPTGTLTTLYSFSGSDGSFPVAGVIQAADGNFYGSANSGGSSDWGTVFKLTPTGTLTTLHSFSYSDGAYPSGALVQTSHGNFYSTTAEGGKGSGLGCNGCGTIFSITPAGTLTTVHSFRVTDGSLPMAGLIQATDGNFYGTTSAGGTGSPACGTIFKITPKGALTVLHNFTGTDGCGPGGALLQATDGNLYGTTESRGTSKAGTVFKLSVGLGPFVQTVPTTGATGTAVTILGTNLTGATAVTFHGTPAVFTVVSATEITTSVPAGATPGKVQVTTPSGTLSSNVSFSVR